MIHSEPSSITNWSPGHPALTALVTAFLRATPAPLFVVGGAVRDFLLDPAQPLKDLDLVTGEPALPLARRVADEMGWAYYPLDAQRDVARLVLPPGAWDNDAPLICDVAHWRGGSLAGDLAARDFTVNAMALVLDGAGDATLTAHLVDPHNGQADLASATLRPVSERSLIDDPMRLLRAVRMAVRFNLTMTPALQTQIRALAPTLADPSIERVRDELWKMLAGPHPAQALTLLDDLGLLRLTLPELAACMGVTQSAPHHLDVYFHSLEVITYAAALRRWLADPTGDHEIDPTLAAMLAPWRQRLHAYFDQELSVEHSRGELLVWSALFHDVGKPATRTEEIDPDGNLRYRFFNHEDFSTEMARHRMDTLRLSRREITLAGAVVQAHMRPHSLLSAFPAGRISRRALFRFVRDVGTGADPDAAVDVALLALADRQATGAGAAAESWPAYLVMTEQILAYVLEERPATAQPLVDGRQVMDHLNLPPSRVVGQVMNALAEAQAVGEINTTEEALAWAAAFLKG